MFQFFKESVSEMRHVAWPTRTETKKYMMIVVGILAAFSVYLFIAGNVFSEVLFVLRDLLK